MSSKKIFIIMLCFFVIFMIPINKALTSNNVFKVYSDLITLYSFSNQIQYYAISQNNQKIIFLIKEKHSNKNILYLANANGTGIKELFRSGLYLVDSEEKNLEIGNNLPVISGDGSKVLIGLNPANSINYKSDYFMVYDLNLKRFNFFSLRILISGTTYTRFPREKNDLPFYSVDFLGTKIVSQTEIGLDSQFCESYDTSILICNIDGSNQKILVGPSQFNRNNCSFEWVTYPKSPHYPIITYNGDRVVFFGQVFLSNSPYEKSGELFVINSNGSNLRQLTFSKRFDKKVESYSYFISNYYGSRIFFKYFFDSQFYVSSLSIDGGTIQNHILTTETNNFFISGDGRKVFFIDPFTENSLVYFDIMSERKYLVIDFSWSGLPNNYKNLSNIYKEINYSNNLSDFSGKNFYIKSISSNNYWIYLLNIDDSIISLRETIVETKIGSTTASINDKLISLDVSPYLINNRTMIPLRLITDGFGIKYIWNTSKQEITLKINGNIIQLFINKKYIYVNNKREYIEIAPEIKLNRVIMPIKVVSNNFGFTTLWDNNQTIIIKRVNIIK